MKKYLTIHENKSSIEQFWSKKELADKKMHGLTMEDLRKFVNKNPQISDNTKVLVERIEDKYFINNWRVLTKEGDFGEEQFFPAWCISKDEDFIYIFNHY